MSEISAKIGHDHGGKKVNAAGYGTTDNKMNAIGHDSGGKKMYTIGHDHGGKKSKERKDRDKIQL